MHKVIVIGMGMSVGDLTAAQLEMVRSADLLVGGRRHLEAFDDLAVEKMAIAGDLEAVLAAIGGAMEERRVVVLASGDPLFFGIGARIVSRFGPDRVSLVPNVSSVAAACARMGEPWGEAAVISLHARDRRFELLEAMRTRSLVMVLTDRRQSPAWLARWLLDRAVGGWRMAVCERLGGDDERVGWYDLAQAGGVDFAQPNVVILKRRADASAEQLHLGMADTVFDHEQGLITKSEVRAVTLARLRLRPGMTLWDLGAGSGSVGIEAAVLLGPGRIVAVEQDARRAGQIRENARHLGVHNLDVIRATLPDGLESLPRPDRIFIGGGGRDLAAIIQKAAAYLPADGVLAANTVLMDNLTAAAAAMEASGLSTDVVQLQIGIGRSMPWSRRFEARNPVWIVVGERRSPATETETEDDPPSSETEES